MVNKEKAFALFKILHLIGFQSDEMCALTFHPSMNQASKVNSFTNCAESNVQLVCLRITVGKAFPLHACNKSPKCNLDIGRPQIVNCENLGFNATYYIITRLDVHPPRRA